MYYLRRVAGSQEEPWCLKQYTEKVYMELEYTTLEYATIVLVGCCNGDPRLQTYIGTIVFREDGSGNMEPRLINITVGEDVGTPQNPFVPTFVWKRKGGYGVSFPVARGHGIMITLDADKHEYRFTTGISHGDSGSSGPITHGGPELVVALNELFGFTGA